MNQNGLYYALICCCLAYIILVGQRFTIKNTSFFPSKSSMEPVVVISQPPPLFISNTQVHRNGKINTPPKQSSYMQSKKQFIADTLGIEVQKEEDDAEQPRSSDKLPYFIGTLAKMNENVSSQNPLVSEFRASEQHKKISKQQDRIANESDNKIDEFSQQLRLVLSTLYHVCNKVNAPLLIDRIEARLHLASIVVPGLLGRCFDCVVARALPRYFTQEGAFYSYQHDSYIMEDLITLLQYQYILPSNERKVLYEYRKNIMQHYFNKRLSTVIQASKKNDTALLEKIRQPYDPLIALMYQEITVDN